MSVVLANSSIPASLACTVWILSSMRVSRINDIDGSGRLAAMLDRSWTQSEIFLLVGVAFAPSINACRPASPQKSMHEAGGALSSKLNVIPPYMSSYSRRRHAKPSTLPLLMTLECGEAFPEAVDAVIDIVVPHQLYSIAHTLRLEPAHEESLRPSIGFATCKRCRRSRGSPRPERPRGISANVTSCRQRAALSVGSPFASPIILQSCHAAFARRPSGRAVRQRR